jgi:hypothetical protein
MSCIRMKAGLCCCRADSCVVAASEDALYMWQFRNNFTRQLANEPTAASAGASGSTPAANAGTAAVPKLQREGRERMLHIDSPANAQVNTCS